MMQIWSAGSLYWSDLLVCRALIEPVGDLSNIRTEHFVTAVDIDGTDSCLCLLEIVPLLTHGKRTQDSLKAGIEYGSIAGADRCQR